MESKLRRVAYHKAEVATLERAPTAPLGFNTGAATFYLYMVACWSWLLVPLEFVFAYLGRWLWIAVHNTRRPKAA